MSTYKKFVLWHFRNGFCLFDSICPLLRWLLPLWLWFYLFFTPIQCSLEIAFWVWKPHRRQSKNLFSERDRWGSWLGCYLVVFVVFSPWWLTPHLASFWCHAGRTIQQSLKLRQHLSFESSNMFQGWIWRATFKNITCCGINCILNENPNEGKTFGYI